MNDEQRLTRLELQMVELEKSIAQEVEHRKTCRSEMEGRIEQLIKKAEAIYNVLAGTLEDRGLIPRYGDLEKLVHEEMKPRVDSLWADRLKLMFYLSLIAASVGLVTNVLLKHFKIMP